MKRIIFALLLAAGAAHAALPDLPIGRLPNGEPYLKEEVDFCLKADVARGLSTADATRRRVVTAPLIALHPSIIAVVGGHLSADKWLNGEPLPAALKHTGPEVPTIARSLKARLRPGTDAAVVVEELRQHPDVEWASLNRLHPVDLVPNDTLWTNQWGPLRINATNGWDVPQTSANVRVAVIDTGVDLFHPDLANAIVYNLGFGANTSGDANRDVRGGTSIDHGTHVTGIAAAIRNNNLGIAGVAVAGIMAYGCSVWDGTNYLIGFAANAINDAVANGAVVINCSFGNAALDASESNALNTAMSQGVVVVCAAGNNGTNILNSPSAGWTQHSWPLLVSNTQMGDTLSPNSNFGNSIGLAAPGTGIFSTVTTNFNTPAPGTVGTYQNLSGTSMASPHVAGAVAILRGMSGGIGGAGVKDLLYRMAQDLGTPGFDQFYGNGLLQLPASFLSTLKNANTFAGFNAQPGLADGTYDLPYTTLQSALADTPAGGTLVLNAGIGGPGTYNYAAQTINSNVVLTAFPDRPVTIGK